MKIGVDIRAMSALKPTGVGLYAKEALFNILKNDNFNQYLLFYSGWKKLDLKIQKEIARYKNAEVRHLRLPNKILNLSLLAIGMPRIDKYLGNLDIIWFPNLNFYSLSKHCKNIITIHDLSYLRLPETFSLKMRIWHALTMPQKKMRLAEKIIAVSKNTKRDIIELYKIPPEKIEVIYSGAESIAGIGIGANNEFFLPKKYILFFGALEPRKNIIGILQALNKNINQEIKLVIGGPNGWLYRKIFKAAKKYHLQNRIIFMGYVDPEHRLSLYKNALALIWPSFLEGFGFPPLESNSCSLPVITSNGSSLPEVLESAALLVDPYNCLEIAKAIKCVYENDKLRQLLIAKGKLNSKRFLWQNTAIKLLQLFNKTYENRN